MKYTMPSVREIVRLIRDLDDEHAVALIQKYADATATIRVDEAARETFVRVARIVEGGMPL